MTINTTSLAIEWIPIDARLPSPNKPVLVFNARLNCIYAASIRVDGVARYWLSYPPVICRSNLEDRVITKWYELPIDLAEVEEERIGMDITRIL